MRRFLFTIAILVVFLLTSVQMRGEEKKFFELVEAKRSLSKELNERRCGPYFVLTDFGGRAEPSLSFYYLKDGRLHNDVLSKSRLRPPEINDEKPKPIVLFGTNSEGRETGLFILNTKDYKETEGCLPEPKK